MLILQGCPFHLELRQTQNKGWALHTLDAIPAGTFVIDYTGLIRHQTLLDDSSTQSSWRDGDTVEADHGEDTAANHDEYAFDMEAPRPGCEDMDLPLLPVLGSVTCCPFSACHQTVFSLKDDRRCHMPRAAANLSAVVLRTHAHMYKESCVKQSVHVPHS